MSTNQEREWIDADKLREVIEKFTAWEPSTAPQSVETANRRLSAIMEVVVDNLEALLPNPQPRNLEEMTRDEREACQWMQADFDGEMVLLTKVSPDRVAFLHRSGTPGVYSSSWFHRITPLPDLRRMEWPEEQE